MKDIKQYFANDRNIVDKEAAIKSNNDAEDEERQQEENVGTGKRKRVKIRISRSSSASRMCDIVDSKTDLIDKTPSPFNGEVNNGHRIPQDETPKSDSTKSGAKRHLEKHLKPAEKMDGNQSEEPRNISQEKEHIVNIDNCPNSHPTVDFNDETESEFHNEIGSQREESNAFQVLMSRNKPIQYKSPSQQSVEDIENNEKSDHAKEMRFKHKEKLIALADKKGFSKKKMAEIEEGERIEKNIENRIKFFKGENKNNLIHKKANSFEESVKSTKQSGNLLNYFR